MSILVSSPEKKKEEKALINNEEEKKSNVKLKEKENLPANSNKRIWLTEELNPADPSAVSYLITSEINSWAGRVNQQWSQYLLVLAEIPHRISLMFCEEYNRHLSNALRTFIYQTESNTASFPALADREASSDHENMSKELRSLILAKNISSIPVFIYNNHLFNII